ncbi:epidermal retinol dehydrogenase 2-like [Saccoglossus kowalevskii]|uniref:Epidermal retinol dehydrogenase 2-like n=1 Tax=Saccoglossus kowalevskii TaxID=10224 RepID=A0ABM0MP39_SACKO|nr:PREDICTED: epidermal retinol dehydrogenase 2-like [Saccoglossus kowalevskii]
MSNLLWECLQVTLNCLWHFAVSFVYLVLPFCKPRKDVAGDIVLITGAGSGIGRLMALRFATLQSVVILWDIDEVNNEKTAREIRDKGGRAYSYTVDLSDRDSVYQNAANVKRDVGDVTILINNAGIVTGKTFLDCPDKLIEKTMQVNTMAHFWTVKSFLPMMMKRNYGHIVNIASSAGLIGVSGLADYCASKFGAVGFDESLRYELSAMGKDGVITTVVCPFFINTGMFDGVKTKFPLLLPIMEAEYAANKIVDAVQTKQAMLYMPRILYLFLALKGCV